MKVRRKKTNYTQKNLNRNALESESMLGPFLRVLKVGYLGKVSRKDSNRILISFLGMSF